MCWRADLTHPSKLHTTNGHSRNLIFITKYFGERQKGECAISSILIRPTNVGLFLLLKVKIHFNGEMWKYDRLIYFNAMIICLGIFYAFRLRNTFITLSYLFIYLFIFGIVVSEDWLGSFLWHNNYCMLFTAKSSLYTYTKYIRFGLVGFYGILTLVGNLMPNTHYTYIFNKYDLLTSCRFGLVVLMAYQPL